MKKIVLASNNKHQIKEVQAILDDVEVLTLNDIEYYDEIEETGETFLDNALIKARTIGEYLKEKGLEYDVLADDSGLCCEAINLEPGVYSARYAGDNTTPLQGIEKLLKNMEGVPFENRSAHFVSVIALVLPDGSEYSFEGSCDGYITNILKGDNGFGFDPVFYYPPFDKTFAELSDEEKNSVSHRYVAINKLNNFLNSL